MESELEKYRKKKRIESYKGQLFETIQNGWTRVTGSITRAVLPDKESSSDDDTDQDEVQPKSKTGQVSKINTKSKRTKSTKDDVDANLTEASNDTKSTDSKFFRYSVTGCKILIWSCLFMGFLKLELGAVFVIISMFWLMWMNMNTGRRKKHGRAAGPSAYSVFNPNCEAIDGTLKAEQLEKQLLFRETK